MMTLKYGAPRLSGVGGALLLFAFVACSEVQPAPVAQVADASSATAAAAAPDAGMARVPRESVVSGAAPVAQGTAGDVFASAQAVLAPLSAATDTADLPLEGTATWRTTLIGIDLEIAIRGCTAGPYPIEILEASDCSSISLQAPAWGQGRGTGIPGLLCTTGEGRLSYSRSPERKDTWTIGGPLVSEVVGHALVVRDPKTLAPRACGVIERAPDVVRVALPAASAALRLETRSALVGLCLSRQFSNTSEGCPDAQALLDCASVHCDVGSCLQACQDFTSCLEQSSDTCVAMSTCVASPECGLCQSQLLSCSLGFCAEHSFCAPPLTADGPCSKLEGCCLLQGAGAAACLTTYQTLVTAGGDVNCMSAMSDWDVVAHFHVPCRFEE